MHRQDQLQILTHTEKGYKPLVAFEAWRTACLNDSEKTTPEGLPYFQKHALTDEVFILLKGTCTLILAGTGTEPEELHFIPMVPHTFYNIRKGVWHTHVLQDNTMVCVVENDNTSLDNSPITAITEARREMISQYFAHMSGHQG